MNSHDIGLLIRERRKSLGITLQDLGELSGININTVNKIELGQANPTLKVLLKMMDVLGLDISLAPKKADLVKGGES